jgi:hypothetical protein
LNARRRAVDLAALALACAAAAAGGLVGARGPRRLVVDVGPNDAPYVSGFAGQYEIDDGVRGWRWSGYDARVALPLSLDGPVAASWRAVRVLPETAVVDVSLAGRPLDRFTCRGGALVERRAEATPGAGEAAALAFHVDSHDRRGLGLRFDRVAFELGQGARARAAGTARWLPMVLAGGLFLALRVAGLGVLPALGLALAVGAGVSWRWTRDPVGTLHAVARLAVPAAASTLACAALMRRRPLGQWVVAIFALGYLAKGVAVFQPASFYPDVQQHRRYLVELRDARGGLRERARTAQERLHWGERQVGGQTHALPYSPLFYLPFAALPPRYDLIEDAMRHVALLAAAAEPVAVYFLGAAAAGPAAGALAALLAAVFTPLYSRLLLAMWPSVAGHLLDVLAVLAALRFVLAPTGPALARLAAASLGALLTYIASLLNLGAFLAALAALERKHAPRLLGVLLVAAGLTVAGLYGPFAATFVTEVVPALPAAGPAKAADGSSAGLAHALARIPLFYGWAVPALAAAGLVLLHRRRAPGVRLFAAWALAFAALVFLRAFGAGLFRDLKEILFIGPLMAVLAAVALVTLAARGRSGRAAAVLLVMGLVLHEGWRGRDLLRAHASPVTAGWRETR